jgi:hypothetical protein
MMTRGQPRCECEILQDIPWRNPPRFKVSPIFFLSLVVSITMVQLAFPHCINTKKYINNIKWICRPSETEIKMMWLSWKHKWDDNSVSENQTQTDTEKKSNPHIKIKFETKTQHVLESFIWSSFSNNSDNRHQQSFIRLASALTSI